MKNMKTILTLAIGSFFVFGCSKEIPPTITPCQTNRVVLVEEFTGIRCSGCPTGTRKLKALSKQYGNQLLVVAIHAKDFSAPYNGFSLKTEDGEKLGSDYLGPVSGYPSAVINRKIYKGENELLLQKEKWAGKIGNEICQRPIAELAATTTYDETTRKVSVSVDMTPSTFFTGLIEEDLAITVMITENGIMGYQSDLNTVYFDYEHNHVLRDIITESYTGDLLISKGNILSPQQKVITGYELPADWDADNCHVVAFVHYKGENNKEVIQAIEIALQ